ncbi:MAG TPA: pyridine nucleotide transhydrogenase, partial [Burkholderiaceae bacterium]|nr:pyridine nucleotide transhydrogenase [Burkholderiaceae bacterium]
GRPFDNALANTPVTYDMRTRYAEVFGASGHYQYSARETIQAIRAYAQSEPLAIKPDAEVKS